MAAHGARRLLPMAENAMAVIGIELLAAAQGCDFHAPLASSARARSRARACCARDVPHLDDDRYFHPDMQRGHRARARRARSLMRSAPWRCPDLEEPRA